MTRAFLVAALAAAIPGCVDCSTPHVTFAITTAEAARLTQGTGAPTHAGCGAVCYAAMGGVDVGPADGGWMVDIGPDTGWMPPDPGTVRCSLDATGRTLTCTFPETCAR